MRRTACLLVLLAACAADPFDVGTSEEAITVANVTSSAPYAISLRTRWGGCTAVVLSRHWLITAAHCFAGTPGSENVCALRGAHQENISYYGVSDVYIYPGYHAYPSTNFQAYDFALVRLPGTGLNSFDAARTFAGPDAPWRSYGGLIAAIGYGFGSNAGGPADCPSTESIPPPDGWFLGDKRRGQFVFDGGAMSVAGADQAFDFHSSLRSTCHGDSGGPVVVMRTAGDLVVGLLSTGGGDAGDRSWASLVEGKMSWILQISSFFGPRLSCPLVRDHRDAEEVDWRACTEPDYRVPPLPPPTWSSCENMDPGNSPPG